MDVVQRIHEEMRINLIFQILQLLFYILLLQLRQLSLVVTAFGISLYAQVHAKHQYENHRRHDIMFAHDGRRSHVIMFRTTSRTKRRSFRSLRNARNIWSSWNLMFHPWSLRRHSMFHLLRRHSWFHLLRRHPLFFWLVSGTRAFRTCGALVNSKASHYDRYQREIAHLVVMVNQYGSKEEIVNEEEAEKYEEFLPDIPQVLPFKAAAVACDDADIHA